MKRLTCLLILVASMAFGAEPRKDLEPASKIEYLTAALRASQTEVGRLQVENKVLQTLLDGLQKELNAEQAQAASEAVRAVLAVRDKLTREHNAEGCQIDVSGVWVNCPPASKSE